MNFLIKLSVSIAVIVVCTQVGKKIPSFAGLIAVMPLTGLIVLVWLYLDNRGKHDLMIQYSRGAMWGVLPSFLFFLAAFLCFRKHFSLPIVLTVGIGVWLIGALFHQWFLH